MKKALPCLTLLLAAVFADAITIIGNLPPPNDNLSNVVDHVRFKAMGFTTDGQTYDLKAIRVRLSQFGGLLSEYVFLRLFSNSASNTPGTSLFTLHSNGTILSPGVNTYTYACAGSLQPNTAYWVVMHGSPSVNGFATGNVHKWNASSPGLTPTGNATHFGSMRGVLTPPNITNPSPVMTWFQDDVLNSYELVGNVVPEASTAIGLTIGLALLLNRRRPR